MVLSKTFSFDKEDSNTAFQVLNECCRTIVDELLKDESYERDAQNKGPDELARLRQPVITDKLIELMDLTDQ